MLPCLKQFSPLKVYGGSISSGGSLRLGSGWDVARVVTHSISHMVVICSVLEGRMAGIETGRVSAHCRVVSASRGGEVHNGSGGSINSQLVLMLCVVGLVTR